MKARSGLLLAALTVLLGACVLPQKEDPQSSPIDTQALGLTGASPSVAPDGWWRAFGDPQLDALIEEALAHNPSLAEALAHIRAAQAQAQAAGAGNQPGFTVDGSLQRQRLSENYIYPPAQTGYDPHGGGVYWIGDLGVNLNWDLDFWGRQASLIDQAREQLQAAALDREAARLALAGAIAQAYVDLYRAYALTDVAGQYVEQRRAQLQLTEQRRYAGMEAQLQLETMRAQLAQAQAGQLQAQSARELAVHRLAALSGHGADRYAQYQRPQLHLDGALALPETLPADLLGRRPDVLAARTRVDAASAGRDAAKAAFYPDISLKAFAGYQAVGLDQLFRASSASYGAGPALHLPLFDAQRIRAGYRGATAELDAAVARYNQTVLDAVRDVADQLTLVDSLTRQREAQRGQHDAAEAAFVLAQKRYAAGLSSRLAVLDIESQALNARRDIINTDCQLITSRVSLLLTLGGSFHPESLLFADRGKPSS